MATSSTSHNPLVVGCCVFIVFASALVVVLVSMHLNVAHECPGSFAGGRHRVLIQSHLNIVEPELLIGEPIDECVKRLQLTPCYLNTSSVKSASIRWGTYHFLSTHSPGRVVEIEWVLASDNKERVQNVNVHQIPIQSAVLDAR